MEAEVIDEAFEAELESELRMVREATLLVAAGWARRVVVANLNHGRVILEPAREFATEAGIRLETMATADPRRIDIAAQIPDLEIVGPPA